ncbi:MAG: nuclear transport factor 2 family protein [Thermoanaerobaculia bacterium]
MGKPLSVFFLAVLFAAQTPKGADEALRELLQRQSQELLDAVGSGAAAVWDRYLHPDVRYIEPEGAVLTKKEIVEGMKGLPPGVSGSIQVTRFDVALHGDVAVATHLDDESQDYYGHKLRCQYRTTDTWLKTAQGWRLIAGQVLAVRADPPSVPLSASRRKDYCGRYAITPAISYEIRCRGEALEGQRTGRPAEELRAEAPDVLFVPGRPRYRYVFLRDAAGKITGFAQRREAWDLIWKRAERDDR